MIFNGTFNNISVISCRSVLLLEETGVPGENHWSAASHWQTLSHNVVSSTPLMRVELEETGENHRSAASHWQTLSHNVVSSTPLMRVDLELCCYNKMENKKYHTVWTAPKSNRKIYTSNTQIHDRLLSWLGTGTSIKSGGVKQPVDLWAQASHLI